MRKTCFNQIYELAKKDERVVFIGSDIGAGTLQQFKEEFPDRFFMEGISEQNIIGMAAGMAMEGKIVYVNTIATFLTRRCYEQVVLDLALHNLPVRLLGNGGGLVYAALGPTHLAIDDIAIMRSIPNMTVVAPCDADEMTRLMPQTLDWKGPMYIRFAKGEDKVVSKKGCERIPFADSYTWGKSALVITTGITLQIALEVAQSRNITVIHYPTIKPFDKQTISYWLDSHNKVITIEEHSIIGGLGEAVGAWLAEDGYGGKFKKIGIPDVFPDAYGTQESLMKKYGISVEGLLNALQD